MITLHPNQTEDNVTMPNYKDKLCEICKESYPPSSPKQKYCDKCKEEGRKIADRIRDRKRSRKKFDYKEHHRFCLCCGKEFFTYYDRKVFCGEKICDQFRVNIKNKNAHITRDRTYLIEKGRRYYKENREYCCLKRAERYRELHPEAKEYNPGRVYKHSIDYIRDYVENLGYRLLSEEYVNSKEKILLQCPSGHKWETTFHCFRDTPNLRGARCFHCYINNNYVSKPEQKVRDYILGNFPDIEVIFNDRKKIYPRELDLYFPEYSLAIEICGLYWHSDTATGTNKYYHYNKMMDCYKKGIRLITIFEDEINNKFDVLKSIIGRALNKATYNIHATDCIVKGIDTIEATEFLEDNYIHDSPTYNKAIGLFYGNTLVSVAGINSVNNTVELKINCPAINYNIIGCTNRFIEYITNNNHVNIKCYCDMRYSDIFDPIYELSGFKLSSLVKCTPHYFNSKTRYMGILFKKHEIDTMIDHGYNRIWDCGYRLYTKSYTPAY